MAARVLGRDAASLVTLDGTLLSTMAHELGHGMGLWDCKSCKKKQTIMNGFPGINKDNGLVEASACDLEVVRQVYQLDRRVVASTRNERARD